MAEKSRGNAEVLPRFDYHSGIRTPERYERRACSLFLALGAALRLIQYLGRPSYWIDEIALARNIERFSVARLVRGPLAFQQSAPPGFLALEKLAAALFGAGELSLRLFPLLASLAALLLFPRLLRRCGLPPPAVLAGCALFAASPGLVYYGCELKQYSFDIFFTVILTTLAARDLEAPDPPGNALLAAGAIAPWFSNASVFTVAALCAALAAASLRKDVRRRPRTVLAAGLLAAGAAAAAAAARAQATAATRAYFRRFWADGFAPHAQAARTGEWILRAVVDFFRVFLELPAPILWLVPLAAGAWCLRKRPFVLWMLAGPAGIALGASFGGLYPFARRALAFSAPGMLGLAAASFLALERTGAARRAAGAAFVALAAAAGIAAQLTRHPVMDPEPTRPLLEELARARGPSEPVYVYYGARQAFAFYGLRAGIDPRSAVFGGCHRLNPEEYLEELAPLFGSPRAWILIAHDLPALREREFLERYLGEAGSLVSTFPARRNGEPPAPELLLFDLSKPAPSRDARIAFPRPALSRQDLALASRLGCDGGPQSPDPEFWP